MESSECHRLQATCPTAVSLPPSLLCLARATGLGAQDPRVPQTREGVPSITGQSRAGGRGRGGRWEDKIQRTKMFVWVTFKILFLDTEKYEVNKQNLCVYHCRSF